MWVVNFGIPGESIGLKFIPSQSELFRFIPIFVSEPMRIIPNQSEKRFVSRLMKNGQKSIRLYPINPKTSIRMNPNQSQTKFQSRSIRINPTSDWSKPNFQSESIWINPRSELNEFQSYTFARNIKFNTLAFDLVNNIHRYQISYIQIHIKFKNISNRVLNIWYKRGYFYFNTNWG